MNMDHDLTVVDLFCGGGGFSEGFRQAGFHITHALDHDQRACETYELNTKSTETVTECCDILNFEPSQLPDDVDVLIGSPPCTEFSSAKNGGNGDIDEGMKLVARFLYFVAELEPHYWLMENVPRLNRVKQFRKWLEAGAVPHCDIPWLDDEGKISIHAEVLSADNFGTPQRRRRLFSGNVPLPDSLGTEALNFGDVCAAFPEPIEPPSTLEVEDPLHPDLSIPISSLNDHFYNSYLTEREAKETRIRKEDHSFYGPMSFPDDSNLPARTILAMNRRIARETLVYKSNIQPPDHSTFRKPTIREIASMQGFPITYQFTGSSLAQKWRRVGDAVPPPVAYHLALAILEDGNIDTSDAKPNLTQKVPDLDHNLNNKDNSTKGRRKLSISRNFRHHVPYDDMRKFRVDLTTADNPYPHPLSPAASQEFDHPVRFTVFFYKGYAKSVAKTELPLDEAMSHVSSLLEQHPELCQPTANFFARVNNQLSKVVPDATTLQAIRSRRMDYDEPLEYDILECIAANPSEERRGIVDDCFPYKQFQDLTIELPNLLEGTEIPVRVLMKAVAANYVAHKLNHCSKWILQNMPDGVYIPEQVTLQGELIPPSVECTKNQSGGCVCVEELFRRRSYELTNSKWISDFSEHAD